MTYINGTLVRLKVFDGIGYSDAIYEISSSLTVSNNLEEVTTETGNGWREYRPFGLKSWQMSLSRFYDDEGRELNFNDVYDIITQGTQIAVEYAIGDLRYRGNARIASDGLPFAVDSAIQSSITLTGDGALNKVTHFSLNVGNLFGIYGFSKNSFGSLTPQLLGGFEIIQFTVNNINEFFGDIEGFEGSITVEFPDINESFIANFVDGESQEIVNQDITDYFINNLNQDINFTLVIN